MQNVDNYRHKEIENALISYSTINLYTPGFDTIEIRKSSIALNINNK